jgi:hypothetical protein
MASKSTVYRLARRVGCRLVKGRGRTHLNNRGEFQLVDDDNVVIMGANFDASLDEVLDFLTDAVTDEQQAEQGWLRAFGYR